MGLSKQFVADALKSVPGAAPGSDLVSGGHLVWVAACEGYAAIKLQHPADTAAARRSLAERALETVDAAAARAGDRVDSLIVEFVDANGKVIQEERLGRKSSAIPRPGGPPPAPSPATPRKQEVSAGHTPIGGLNPEASGVSAIRHIVAVGAGKGGVGKSTIALNLAVGLSRKGHSVGLLDGDIYGPSMPTMLGLSDLDPVVREGVLEPFYAHGVKCMTIGRLVQADKPLIWRGPMAHGAFRQLAEQTNWGPLDYLIIDLPPGTGDVSLTMAQLLKLTGAVVVCTPQKVAQDDAVRAARMFEQLGIDVLGVVENMSYFVGDDGKEYDLFGRGGAEHMARRLNVPFLGGVPITMSLRVNSDAGDPSANFTGMDRAGRELVERFNSLVSNLEGQVALAAVRQGKTTPTLTIS
ncbi:Iron-sulfur cluster carrier protein [Phycisphaerales bacterium]|nr:Iron-sulfur cluster carrier protein [Phycisphaerales bacterium]